MPQVGVSVPDALRVSFYEKREKNVFFGEYAACRRKATLLVKLKPAQRPKPVGQSAASGSRLLQNWVVAKPGTELPLSKTAGGWRRRATEQQTFWQPQAYIEHAKKAGAKLTHIAQTSATLATLSCTTGHAALLGASIVWLLSLPMAPAQLALLALTGAILLGISLVAHVVSRYATRRSAYWQQAGQAIVKEHKELQETKLRWRDCKQGELFEVKRQTKYLKPQRNILETRQ